MKKIFSMLIVVTTIMSTLTGCGPKYKAEFRNYLERDTLYRTIGRNMFTPFFCDFNPISDTLLRTLVDQGLLKIDSTQGSALTQTEEAQKAHGLLVMKGIISLTEKGKCHAVQNDYDIVIPLFRRKLVRFQEDEPIIKQHFNFSWQPIEATPFGEIFSQHYFGSPAFEAVVDQSGFYDQDQEGGLHFHLLGRGVETYSLYEKEMWRDK